MVPKAQKKEKKKEKRWVTTSRISCDRCWSSYRRWDHAFLIIPSRVDQPIFLYVNTISCHKKSSYTWQAKFVDYLKSPVLIITKCQSKTSVCSFFYWETHSTFSAPCHVFFLNFSINFLFFKKWKRFLSQNK